MKIHKMEEGEQDEKLHNTDGRSKKRNRDTGDRGCCEKEHMTSEALMKLVAEGKVAICAKQESYLLESGGSRQHAAYKDQCESGSFKRL